MRQAETREEGGGAYLMYVPASMPRCGWLPKALYPKLPSPMTLVAGKLEVADAPITGGVCRFCFAYLTIWHNACILF